MKTIIIIALLVTLSLGFSHSQNQEEQQYILSQELTVQDFVNGVQPFDPKLGTQLSAMSLAAYCSPEKVQAWKCGIPCLNYPHLNDIVTFTGEEEGDNHAFMGYYPSINSIIISFRGTESIINWEEDFDFTLANYPNCEGCQVHDGFLKIYDAMQPNFWNAFIPLRQKYPDATIITTGQSLGAALSTMNAADLINHGITDFLIYNFGSPRVGNSNFANWFTSNHQQRLYRVTHHKDPIPHFAPQDFKYQHLAQEVFYVDSSKPDAEHTMCNMSGEDPTCSNQYSYSELNPLDHNYYMGYNYLVTMELCHK